MTLTYTFMSSSIMKSNPYKSKYPTLHCSFCLTAWTQCSIICRIVLYSITLHQSLATSHDKFKSQKQFDKITKFNIDVTKCTVLKNHWHCYRIVILGRHPVDVISAEETCRYACNINRNRRQEFCRVSILTHFSFMGIAASNFTLFTAFLCFALLLANHKIIWFATPNLILWG